MGLLGAFRGALLAAKVAGRLIDLGIEATKLDPGLAEELRLYERTEGSAPRVAALFFADYLLQLPMSAYLLPISVFELGLRGSTVIKTWEAKDELSSEDAVSMIKRIAGLLDQAR